MEHYSTSDAKSLVSHYGPLTAGRACECMAGATILHLEMIGGVGGQYRVVAYRRISSFDKVKNDLSQVAAELGLQPPAEFLKGQGQ